MTTPLPSPQPYATARLVARRFNVVAKFLQGKGGPGRQLSGEAVDCARAVLVAGRRQADVAREFKKTRQQLNTWVKLFVDTDEALRQEGEGA